MGRLDGKVAIVTGIGRAIAIMFAKEGAKVVVCCRRQAAGEAVVNEITAQGKEAIYLQLDVSNEGNCKEVVDLTVARWNHLDILVNNAGIIGADKPTHETTTEEWDAVFNTDVRGGRTDHLSAGSFAGCKSRSDHGCRHLRRCIRKPCLLLLRLHYHVIKCIRHRNHGTCLQSISVCGDLCRCQYHCVSRGTAQLCHHRPMC